jgi:toxin-antitoxin system PIN domain toxin
MTKSPYLLDVNVLLALAWPTHQFYADARSWFRRHSRQGWATCAVTQLGFIRLSSNPAFTPDAKTPGESRELLVQLTEIGKHRYLDTMPSLADKASRDVFARILGHKQITDAYLVHICRDFGCRLATFDQRLAAVGNGREVLCIKPTS